ncbi:siderophore-interacting protein [Streptomyces scopuliridis]|uniref:siderophore-interacting protein n=1 Tax=Streptomyces scopuliridis TaxID=452529 RepID=UPI0036962D1D
MARVTFGGPSLADFTLDGPDQQVKLYFPRPGQRVPRLPEAGTDGDVMRWYGAFQAIPEEERPWTRSYTVRSHDPLRATIDIDFVLHGDGGDGADAGPATSWARKAAPGAVLGMFGPSAYFVTPVPLGTTDWLVAAFPAASAASSTASISSRSASCSAVASPADSRRTDASRALNRGTWPYAPIGAQLSMARSKSAAASSYRP